MIVFSWSKLGPLLFIEALAGLLLVLHGTRRTRNVHDVTATRPLAKWYEMRTESYLSSQKQKTYKRFSPIIAIYHS